MKTKTKKNIDKLNMEASYDFILFNVFMFFPVSFVSMLFLSSPHWLNMHNVELNKNRDKQDCVCSSCLNPCFLHISYIYIYIYGVVCQSLFTFPLSFLASCLGDMGPKPPSLKWCWHNLEILRNFNTKHYPLVN